MSNIGLMEGAFFVGRKEILDWINSTLDLNLLKIEDTANGGVACQLLDIMYPGQVPISKVNWGAKQDFEFVGNYKILQTCFEKLKIEKHIDVDRLIAGRYMDNLEFMQWFKRFFEMGVSNSGSDYDAISQRAKGKGGAQFFPAKNKNPLTKPSTAPSKKENAAPVNQSRAPTAPVSNAPNKSRAAANTSAPAVNNLNNRAPPSPPRTVSTSEDANLRASLEESQKAVGDLKTEMEGLEKERNFYFEKLRDIEILLQELEDKGQGSELSASIFKILYATAEGFEVTDEEPATDMISEPIAEETY